MLTPSEKALRSWILAAFSNFVWSVISNAFGNYYESQHFRILEKRGKQRSPSTVLFLVKYMFAVWHEVLGLMSGYNLLIFQMDHFKYMLENALFQTAH